MDFLTFAVQLLNGVQYGLVLFLVASGLTLVFGILGVINLAHGAFYMLGAYLTYWIAAATGSFWLALLGGVAIAFAWRWRSASSMSSSARGLAWLSAQALRTAR